MAEIRYEIKRKLATLSTNEKSGWTKEVNIVSWNGGSPKLDIRDWNPDHTKLSKGITLTEQECRTLAYALAEFR